VGVISEDKEQAEVRRWKRKRDVQFLVEKKVGLSSLTWEWGAGGCGTTH